MSSTDAKKDSIPLRLDRVPLEQKIPFLLSQQILDKIRYLCQEIKEVEWSGVLFYTLDGSIREPEKMKLTVQDILPMDKGTAGHTQFSWDNRFVDYLSENDERIEWTTGLIHSHNRMSVFFSGEDWSELEDNCPNHNFYLSLIVNNAMEMCAKVAVYVKADLPVPEVPFTALDEDGNTYVIAKKDYEVVKHQMFVYNCDVIRPEVPMLVDDDFKEKVAGIIKKEADEAEARKAKATTTAPYHHNGLPAKTEKKETPQSPGKSWSRTAEPDTKKKGHRSKRGSFISEFAENTNFKELEDDDDDVTLEPIEYFAIALFKGLDQKVLQDDTLSDELEMIKMFKIEGADLALTVMEHYSTIYDRYFPDADDQEFISDAEMVSDIIADEEMEYPFVRTTVLAIRAMAKKLEENGSTIPTA